MRICFARPGAIERAIAVIEYSSPLTLAEIVVRVNGLGQGI